MNGCINLRHYRSRVALGPAAYPVRPCERVRGFLEKIRASLQESMRQQVTLRGVIFTAMTLMVGIAAFASANNLLFLLLAAMLATLLLSGFISRLGLAGLELNLDLPEHIAARRAIVARVRITNAKALIPSFSLSFTGAPESGMRNEMYIPVIPARATLQESVHLEFARRGVYRDNAFFFTSEFPFGFTRRRARVHLDTEVLVYPPLDPHPGIESLANDYIGEMDARRRGQGHDFYRIRPYDVLESARHVDWKATAHTGDLQVREYAIEDREYLTILLDLDSGAETEQWFENAVAAAAYLVWRLATAGFRVRFMTQHFDRRTPDECTPYTILKYLALVIPDRGTAAPSPHADRSLQIVLSARADELVHSGWHAAEFVPLRSRTESPGTD